jgi:hypothetical protein
VAVAGFICCGLVLAASVLAVAGPLPAEQTAAAANSGQPAANSNSGDFDCDSPTQGSPYIPVDSWIYPAVLRLYSLGYVDTAFLNMRPWTRSSLGHMLEETADRFVDEEGESDSSEAEELYDALKRESDLIDQGSCAKQKGSVRVESVYSVVRGISGTPLRDSFHLGSTIVNDYGRPYAAGFNNYSGVSGYASAGRFVLYARGEFHGAPSATGYSSGLAATLVGIDETTYIFNPTCVANEVLTNPSCIPMPDKEQTTIPLGPINSTANVRVMEAYVSAQYLNNIISFGKQDDWQGPGLGGAMSYSNNAENIYSFRINRIEPVNVPLLSRLTGPFRYEFLIGPLKGHTFPIDPWVHVEKISFRPTANLEFGFERTAIWGGKGHVPITLKSFLRSFFSVTAPQGPDKNSSRDPGARFGAFDFSYRLPFVRNWLTLYCDSEVHDDVSPIDAPRRASWRPGIYLSHVPGIPKLDVRVEGVSTEPPVRITDPTHTTNGSLQAGRFMYWEGIQRQGYTNNGQMFGDWIGREAKGGQGWISYHLSGNEWVQVGLRNQKTAPDFIPGGTTLDDINFQVVKRIRKDLEIDGSFALEHWKAPIYLPGQHTVTTTTVQLTWFPGRKVGF